MLRGLGRGVRVWQGEWEGTAVRQGGCGLVRRHHLPAGGGCSFCLLRGCVVRCGCGWFGGFDLRGGSLVRVSWCGVH